MQSLLQSSMIPRNSALSCIKSSVKSSQSKRSILSSTSRTYLSTMAPIRRITMFKIPNPDDIQPLLEKYSTMQKDAVKVGTLSSMLLVALCSLVPYPWMSVVLVRLAAGESTS